MKKILVWETSPSVAGGQKMTLTVMELLKNEYEFHCLIPGEGALSQRLRELGISYTVMGDQTLPVGVKGMGAYFRYGWLSLKNIIGSMNAIHRFRPDILYAPGPAALPWSAVCGLLRRKKVVWHLHHMFADGPTKKLLNLTGKWGCVRQIVAVSQAVGSQITSQQGRQKLTCLYNPIDLPRYANGNGQQIRSEITAALGSPPEKILAEVAILRETKLQDLFVDIIAALRDMGSPVTGVLVGDAITDEDRQFKQTLLEKIRALGLEDRIYLAGHRENVGDYLAASDAVLVPSPVEGLSLAAQEAMSAKRTVFAPDTGGAAELLRLSGSGCLYSHLATPAQIAGVIAQMLEHPDEEKIENGYRFCLECTPEAYARRLRQIFTL